MTTSASTPAKPAPQHQQTSPPQQQPLNPTSPPTRRDLKSWWKRFQTQSRHQDAQAQVETRPQGIFGVPLRQSIPYANVAISLVDDNGKSYIYGYVPIVVAKCGVFLKEKATSIEGIFRLSGSEKRIKELKHIFDSPDRYGKGLVWDGFNVHDAANVLRRYLNDLPEPVVPLDLYEKFRDPLRGHTKQAVGDTEGAQLADTFNEADAIVKYQDLIKDLPPLNRQLLLYLLDLLAVFAAKADENRMTAQNLAAIFQPGMLSHPAHAMAPEEYRLNQCVIIFLIENQDHFLIGMQGTAADEKTKQAIEKASTPAASPIPVATAIKPSGINRSASNASAGAESVSREGMVRRNRSTSSRHSRNSNGASTPNSPSVMGPVSAGGGSGLSRSNTVPSKRSPHVVAGRFQRGESPATAVSPSSPSPLASFAPSASAAVAHPPTVREETAGSPEQSSPTSSSVAPIVTSNLAPGSHLGGRSQERLLESGGEATTPSKEKNLQALFQRSPTADAEKRAPNKLRKKRIPGSANPSAQSSTASLTHSGPMSPPYESSNPMDKGSHLEPPVPEHQSSSVETATEPITPRAPLLASSAAPQAAQMAEQNNQNHSLKPRGSPHGSLHSSFNEGSDADQHDEATPATAGDAYEKDKKRRWRMSRRREEQLPSTAAGVQNLGVNQHAEMSSSSIGSGGHKPRKSWTGESSDMTAVLADAEHGARDQRDEPRGPLGWIKNKVREARENAENKRTKSPPGEQGHHAFLVSRGKSLDIKRGNEDKMPAAVTNSASQTVTQGAPQGGPQNVPLPMSPPATQMAHDEKRPTPESRQ